MLSILGKFALRWEVATADESSGLAPVMVVAMGAMMGCRRAAVGVDESIDSSFRSSPISMRFLSAFNKVCLGAPGSGELRELIDSVKFEDAGRINGKEVTGIMFG